MGVSDEVPLYDPASGSAPEDPLRDEHSLALGRAVYTFQAMEWLTIWMAAMLDDGKSARYDSQPFDVVVRTIETRLNEDPSAGAPARTALEELVPLLTVANQLRLDVFHTYPVYRNLVVRRRPKSGELLDIDVSRLNGARENFEHVMVEVREVWLLLWREAMGSGSES